MNASRARKEGRKQFCPGDKPTDYFERTGRNPSLYELQCFTQGWDEEAAQYEAAQKFKEKTKPEPDYEELFLAAKRYIDESPCDPDHYPEQLEAWNNYQELLEQYDV